MAHLPHAKASRTGALLARPLLLAALVSAAWTFPAQIVHASAWQVNETQTAPALRLDLPKLIAAVPAGRINSEPRVKAMQALDLIGKNKLDEGSALMNAALQLDPSNSYLQFFNAFTYHLMGQQGDAQKFSLAEQGYALAVQFDRSNWIARYFLGVLRFEQRNYRAAQAEFAEVLLFRANDPDALFRLVAASYYAGDAVTAAACLDRLRALHPADAQVLRLSAIISAAIGRADEAKQWLERYQTTQPDAAELARTRERIEHWALVHRSGVKAAPLAMSEPTKMPNKSPFVSKLNAPAFIRTQASANQADAQSQPVDAAAGVAGGQRMVLVDVVIMRTEDSLSTRKGMNLLNTLALQFGSGSAPSFSKTITNTTDANGVATTTTLTRAITIPALTYSLNIANSNTNLNEVLARPTLAALEGVKSEFFSGTTLNAAVVATGANSGGAVQIEKEIGVKLSITPTFLSDNKLRLMVDAQRTFLKPPSQDVNFTFKVEVSKIMVNANVVMDFGETLILGGLSEKETSRVRDGVPLLQDVPGVQYLFSRSDSTDFQRSVLMLITPRAPQYTYRSDETLRAEAGGNADAESLKELRARYGDWFKPYPNMASVFNHLSASSVYREFRTGDVTLEKWDRQVTTQERLKQALEFLFY
ncbi:MAG: hypothetical protein HYS18_15895 [Burkholderiales bacterium]|nr:hypothetical protein [Burkholderiales bacterium]